MIFMHYIINVEIFLFTILIIDLEILFHKFSILKNDN